MIDLDLVVPGSTPLPVAAELRYDAAEPYAVTLSFRTGGPEPVEWTFARDLLLDGVVRPAGLGDVRVWTSSSERGGVVCIALSSPSGQATFEAPRRPLVDFLRRTRAVVAPGEESQHMDLDVTIAALFAGADEH